MSGLEDSEAAKRNYKQPHSARNPIPTVQQYKDYKQKQRQELDQDDVGASQSDSQQQTSLPNQQAQADKHEEHGTKPNKDPNTEHETAEETSQTTAVQGVSDPKQKRKQLKHADTGRAERQVTDPVTHLPVTIHDFTGNDLKHAADQGRDDDDDGIDDGVDPKVDSKADQEQDQTNAQLQKADTAQRREHEVLYNRFPPPQYDEARNELARVQKRAALFVLVSTTAFVLLMIIVEVIVPDRILTLDHRISAKYVLAGETLLTVGFISLGIGGVQSWAQKQARTIWDDAVWHAEKVQARNTLKSGPQETTLWLSKLIGSIWPLVNPDLFNSVADTLEDVMQASLPRMVRMVSVDDIGQGSEPFRILGVKWLPKGAASRSIENEDDKGATDQETKDKDSQQQNGGVDGVPPSDANAREDSGEVKDDQVAAQDSNEGMGAEEGEFVNVEIAFAYRASRFQKSLKDRSKNAHLLLSFYLPGNMKLPVWVELRGVVGSCRARLQLTPDPPFIALCTLTFMGQPKVDMTCVPLVKRGLNIMDLPLISNFVQSSIDAALSEYVAPKSIPLDLQAMLVGDDFKKDTAARGVLVCRIKRAFDFKAGDVGIPIVGKEKSSDAYVSVSWAKFGKPLWSTRIIIADMEPYWEETAYLLVTPEELDAEESLRVQLWDSDKFSADDDLGRIELALKDLMRDERTNGKMSDRTDPFKALEVGKGMPGRLEWSVGYYSKVRLLESQMKAQIKDDSVRTTDQLKKQVYDRAEKKLREAAKNEQSELDQLKEDDWENEQLNIITSTVPPEEYPSGVLSIHIHQIVGLSVENVRRNKSPEEEDEADDDGEDQLPDSYCTMILNDQKIFKTRTKPKNAAPFFNACTERFVRDWRNTTVMISVRDARVHEDDPLLGHVYLDLGSLFRQHKTSRINSFWPLSGGIGYGRVRISLVFRSANMQMQPRELGWDTGVIEVNPDAFSADGLPKDVAGQRIKLHTNTSKGHMHSSNARDSGATAKWSTKKSQPLLLAVRKRYASNLTLSFKASSSGLLPKSKRVLAFCVAWLKDIPDEEWTDLQLPVYRDKDTLLERAAANVLPDEVLRDAKLGELRVRVKFWRGLGTPHKSLAKRNIDVADVLEVRDAARELGNGPAVIGAKGWRQERDAGSDSAGGAVDESAGSDSDNEGNSLGVEKEGNFKSVGENNDVEHDHMSKVGALAQKARRKIPFSKSRKEAKEEEDTDKDIEYSQGQSAAAGHAEPESQQTKDVAAPSPTRAGANDMHAEDKHEFSEADTRSSQQAPSAPHASIGPTHGSDAVKEELRNTQSQGQQTSRNGSKAISTPKANDATLQEPDPDIGKKAFSELDTHKSQEAPSPAQVTKGPTEGSDTVKDAISSGRGRSDTKENEQPRKSTSQTPNYSLFPRESSQVRSDFIHLAHLSGLGIYPC